MVHCLYGDATRNGGHGRGGRIHPGISLVVRRLKGMPERELRDEEHRDGTHHSDAAQRDRSGPGTRAGPPPGQQRRPVEPDGSVYRGARQDDHEEGVVLKGGNPPVGEHRPQHALEQQRDQRK